MQLISFQPTNNGSLKNLDEFKKKLRRYQKKSVINSSITLLWDIFKNSHNMSERDQKYSQLVTSHGSRIILLALATNNDHRNKIATHEDFVNLCKDFNHIKDIFENEVDDDIKSIIHYLKKPQNDKLVYCSPLRRIA